MSHSIHRQRLVKPDGRELFLYARAPLDGALTAPMPPGVTPRAEPHLRWHPVRGEWVAYAGNRQDRTFLPPPDLNPLAPTTDPRKPTELPAGAWEMAVFENRFPSFSANAHKPPPLDVPTMSARGRCEVVVFTQDPDSSLGRLPLDRVAMLFEVWRDRTIELGRLEAVSYVMPFENRGAEVGVTLHHPHGQIYAYPFVPPLAAVELGRQREYKLAFGRSLFSDIVASEVRDGRRVLFDEGPVVAFVPSFARYPYEVWIVPRQPIGGLDALDRPLCLAFARALKSVLLRYDGLWSRPFPYILVVHQAPTDGQPHPEAHVHLELYPAYRSRDRLKFLAGTEIGAGTFVNDRLPEETAAELLAVAVELEPALP
jgi:UDPglucose--hexose-1-phosphate uridylyltransferase